MKPESTIMKLCNKANDKILEIENRINEKKKVPSPVIEKPVVDKKAKERQEFKAKMLQDRKKLAGKGKNDFFVEINNVPAKELVPKVENKVQKKSPVAPLRP